MNLLVLCNPNHFAKKIISACKIGNMVTGFDQFSKSLSQIHSYDGMVILAELDWNEKGEKQQLQNYYGITLAQNLRLKHRINLPILFVSFQNPERVLKDQRNEIIASVGHSYCQLPSHPKEWADILKQASPLNELQLSDISYNFCNVFGLVGEVFHRIKGTAREKLGRKESLTDVIQYITDSLSELNELLVDNEPAGKAVEELKSKLSGGTSEDLVQFLRSEESQILSFIKDESEEGNTSFKDKPWKVLLLDDQPDSLSNIVESLHKRGIKDLVFAETSEEAKKLIEADSNNGNQINVVISDYRLLEKNDKEFLGRKQQPEQGYDFLIWLAKQERLNRLIALSGLGKRFLLNSFRKSNIRVSVYSKTDLSGGANLFADDIESYGDEVYEALCALPTAEKWNQLKPFYTFYRNSKDYEVVEDYISNQAREIVSQVANVLSDKGVERERISRFTMLKDLTADMTGKSPVNEKHFEIFKSKMIGRRVALWLYSCVGLENTIIAAIMKKGVLDKDSVKPADVKSLFNMLAIRFEDFPHRILVEEKAWFTNYMGMKLNDIDELLSQVSYYFEETINKFLEKRKIRPVSAGLKKYMVENKIVLHTRYDAKNATRLFVDEIIEPKDKQTFIAELNNILVEIHSDPYCTKYFEEFNEFVTEVKAKFDQQNFKR
jgi:CheY-like chemotaxis protein